MTLPIEMKIDGEMYKLYMSGFHSPTGPTRVHIFELVDYPGFTKRIMVTPKSYGFTGKMP